MSVLAAWRGDSITTLREIEGTINGEEKTLHSYLSEVLGILQVKLSLASLIRVQVSFLKLPSYEAALSSCRRISF